MLKEVPTTFKFKQELFAKRGASIRSLILGSSHMHYGVIAHVVDPSGFNLAAPSQPLIVDSQLLKHNFSELSSLRTVVFEFWWPSFLYKQVAPQSRQRWRDPLYLHWQHVCERPLVDRVLLPEYWSLLPSVGQLVLLRWLKLGSERDWLAVTSSRRAFLPDGSANNLQERVEFIDNSRSKMGVYQSGVTLCAGPNTSSDIVAELKSALQLCRERHIRVVFVSTPLHSSFVSLIDKKVWHQEISKLENICREYGASYLDFTTCLGTDQSCFRDSDHLNLKGAVLFSGLLSKRLAELPATGTVFSVEQSVDTKLIEGKQPLN